MNLNIPLYVLERIKHELERTERVGIERTDGYAAGMRFVLDELKLKLPD